MVFGVDTNGLSSVLMVTAELLSRVDLIPKSSLKLVWIFRSFVLLTTIPTSCPELGVQLPLSHARGFLRIFLELTS